MRTALEDTTRRPQDFLQESVVQVENVGSKKVGEGAKGVRALGLDCMYLARRVSWVVIGNMRRGERAYGVSVWIAPM